MLTESFFWNFGEIIRINKSVYENKALIGRDCKGNLFFLQLLFCYVKEINLNKAISLPTTLCLLLILNDTFLSMSYVLICYW